MHIDVRHAHARKGFDPLPELGRHCVGALGDFGGGAGLGPLRLATCSMVRHRLHLSLGDCGWPIIHKARALLVAIAWLGLTAKPVGIPAIVRHRLNSTLNHGLWPGIDKAVGARGCRLAGLPVSVDVACWLRNPGSAHASDPRRGDAMRPADCACYAMPILRYISPNRQFLHARQAPLSQHPESSVPTSGARRRRHIKESSQLQQCRMCIHPEDGHRTLERLHLILQ